MNRKETQVVKDHEVSVKIGNAFREAYHKSNDKEMVLELLEQYKEARRKITPDKNGRYGAFDAYLSTQ